MTPHRSDRPPPSRSGVLLRHQAQHVIALTAALWGLDEHVAPGASCAPRSSGSMRPRASLQELDRALACWR